MSEHGKGYVRGTGPTPTTPPPPKPKAGDPRPGLAAGILNDMTDEVTVRRDDLALVLDSDQPRSAATERYAAIDRLRAALAPPQPALREPLTAAYCGRGLGDKCPNYAAHLYIVDRILPVVEAAVSAAADEAWNAALDAVVALPPAWQQSLRDRIHGLRRPTEGSAT